MKWIEWNEWIEGFDLEPLQSDLSELCGNLPMSWEWVSLSKWLDVSDLIKPFQNDQNRWEMNELKWIEWIEVKWVIWWIWLCEPYGKIPMVSRRCPYESDLRWVIWSNPIKMIRFNEKWMNWSEMSEMKWNEWFDGNDLEQPYGKGPMSRLRVSLWKWLEMLVIWSNPIKMIRIDEKWMNRVNRGEMSEWMEMTWNNPMGKSLWVGWECPYQSDWNEPYENVPIKMNGIDEKWMKWSE